MAVRYILGRVSSGKTFYIYQEVRKELQKGAEKLFLVVPEQNTLQTERELVSELKLPGIMNLEVLSFTRLVNKILTEAGGSAQRFLNSQGKNMLLKKVLADLKGELSIYRGIAHQDSFVMEVCAALSEFKKYNISAQGLKSFISQKKIAGVLGQKLADLYLIYERFSKYIAKDYLDSEDRTDLAVQKMAEVDFLKGAIVWLDGFTDFNPQTLKLIDKLMLLSRQFTMTLPVDDLKEKEQREMFKVPRLTYEKVHQLAVKNGLTEEIISLPQSQRQNFTGKSQEIIHLEKELFASPPQKYQKQLQDIEVFACSNLTTEVESAAMQVLNLVKKRNYRWQEIAVVCSDLQRYGGLIKRIFSKYGIPIFLQHNLNLLNNPVSESIVAVLDIISNNYQYEDIFQFCKNGLSNLEPAQYEELEIYALKYGISGERWKKDFKLGRNAKLLNQYRKKLICPFLNLEKELRSSKNCLEISRALYNYLEEISFREKIQKKIDKLESDLNSLKKDGDYNCFRDEAAEMVQAWNTVMEIIEQIIEFMGEEEMSLKEYVNLVKLGLSSSEITVIPPAVDRLLVSNLQKTENYRAKALFVLGVNDGLLPAGKAAGGIITPEEKDFLEKSSGLGQSREIKLLREKFAIYQVLSKPEAYLWISYPLADNEGKALRPSILIYFLQNIFTSLSIKKDTLDYSTFLTTPEGTFNHLIKELGSLKYGGEMGDFWWSVYEWYKNHADWALKLNEITDFIFQQKQVDDIKPSWAKELYGTPLRCSVSRLERFVNCPFAHFVQYGLRPKEEEFYRVEAPDIGQLLHNSLSVFLDKVKEKKLNWQSFAQKDFNALANEVIDEIISEDEDSVYLSSFSSRYLLTRLKRICATTAWAVLEQLKRGDFTPLGEEVKFGSNSQIPPLEIKLTNGDAVYLEGRIDRIDVYYQDGTAYVRIIDYKSSSKRLKLADVYHGISLQLFVYLSAVCQAGEALNCEAILPAGVFYCKMDDPLVEGKNTPEYIAKEILKSFKLTGLALGDVEVVRKMDRNISGWSEIIPVAVNKNGEFYKNSVVLEKSDFIALMEYVKSFLQKVCEEILAGCIEIRPINYHGQKGCDYCLYRSICCFDTALEGNRYRNLAHLKDDEVLAKIRSKRGGEVDGQLD